MPTAHLFVETAVTCVNRIWKRNKIGICGLSGNRQRRAYPTKQDRLH